MTSLRYAEKYGYGSICIESKTREKLVRHFGKGTSILFDIFEAYYKKKNASYGIGYMKACTKKNSFFYKNKNFMFISRDEIYSAIKSLDSDELSEIINKSS
tara:strand:- start:224 stop:526 length:303 start_codon:yes stop_codon:yes gene_type:complete